MNTIVSPRVIVGFLFCVTTTILVKPSLGTPFEFTGSRFQGVSQASGGTTEDSATNYPLVQLRHIDNEQVTFLLVDPLRSWSNTSFFSLPARGFVPGPTLVTVFTNGIPSESKCLVVPQ